MVLRRMAPQIRADQAAQPPGSDLPEKFGKPF
jgi:hypothetical protein